MENLGKLLGQFNKGSKYDFNTKDLEFKKIKDFYIAGGLNIFPAYGLIKNTKNEFGVSFSIMSKDMLINVPSHMNITLEKMYENDDVTEAFNNKQIYVQFIAGEYNNNFGKGETHYVNFLTLDDVNKLERERA